MSDQVELFSENVQDTSTLLLEILSTAKIVFVKKLSNNDRDWAQLPNKHQAGIYIPPEQRDHGFFPALALKQRPNDEEAAIRECYYTTLWPQVAETKKTRLVHYTSKGPETHMTGLPKAAFAELSPASYLVMTRIEGSDPSFCCLTIDSASEAASLLVDTLELAPDFHIAFHHPEKLRMLERERLLSFGEQVVVAFMAGDLTGFSRKNTQMPSPADLALMARNAYGVFFIA